MCPRVGGPVEPVSTVRFTLPGPDGIPHPIHPSGLRIVVTAERSDVDSLAIALVPIDSWVRLAKMNGHSLELWVQGHDGPRDLLMQGLEAWGITVDRILGADQTEEGSAVLLDSLMESGAAASTPDGVDIAGSPGINEVVRIATVHGRLRPTRWLRAAAALNTPATSVWLAPRSVAVGVRRVLELARIHVPHLLVLPSVYFGSQQDMLTRTRTAADLPKRNRRLVAWSHYRRKTGETRIPMPPDTKLGRRIGRLWESHVDFLQCLQGPYDSPAVHRLADSLDIAGALKALHRDLKDARTDEAAKGRVARTLHVIDPTQTFNPWRRAR